MNTRNPKLLIYAFGLVWAAFLGKSFEFEEPWFRPWEILIRGSATHFSKNRTIKMEEFGNLAYRHWLREFRHPHETVFTTDGWGFRNAIPFTEPPNFVVIGDSFVAGAGLSDHETITARLSEKLGEPVYNYGAQYSHGPPLFLSDPRFLEFPPRVVIWSPSTRSLQPIVFPKTTPPRPRASRPWWSFAAPYVAIGRKISAWRELIERDNGLGHFAKFTYHETWYRLFGLEEVIEAGPNQLALVETLEQQQRTKSAQERRGPEIVESVIKFAAMLEAKGTKFVFAPIPESGDIYEDRFSQRQRNKIASPQLLEFLFAELERNKIRAIDLRKIFTANRDPYLYMLDDTHWNPRAVELAADALAPELRALEETSTSTASN